MDRFHGRNITIINSSIRCRIGSKGAKEVYLQGNIKINDCALFYSCSLQWK